MWEPLSFATVSCAVFEFLQQPYMQRKMLRLGNIILK